MKKKIFLSIIVSTVLYADMSSFLDDTINAATEQPGYYKSQTRGLYSFGSGKVRYNNMGSFTPVNVELPSLNMGCSGIDATFGGFSYLDTEYLVEKLKAVSAAAPAFAFQMALGVLCEDCKTTLNWLENISNQMNGFNMDTCKASQRIGNAAATSMGFINSNQKSGQSNNFIQSMETMKSNFSETYGDYISTTAYYLGGDTELAKEEVDKKTFQGSLIEEAIEKSNNIDVSILGLNPENGNLFTSIVRAIVGDIVGYKVNITNSAGDKEAGSGDGTFKLKFIPKQSANFKAFLEGGKISYIDVKTQTDNKGMPAVKAGVTDFSGIKTIYKIRIESIVNTMESRQAISDDDRKFINSMPLPIAKYLNTTVLAAIDNTESLIEYLAILETKAFLNFIIQTTNKALSYKIINDSDNQDPKYTKDYIVAINNNAHAFKKETNSWFSASVKEWQKKKTVNDYYIGLEQRMKSRLANSGTFNAGW